MKARSPLLGYNHNVRYAGRLYHVQTEDSGLGNPHVFTHLFFGGTILASKRSNYAVDDPDAAVQKVMQAQHKTMLKELRGGLFDAKLEKHFGEKVVREPSDIEPADSRRGTMPPQPRSSLADRFPEDPDDGTDRNVPAMGVPPTIHDLPTAPLSIATPSPLSRSSPVDRTHQSPLQRVPRPGSSTDPDLRPPAFQPPPPRTGPSATRRPPASTRPVPTSPYGNKPSAEGVVVARPAVIVSDVVASRSPVAPRRPTQQHVSAVPPPEAREPVVENIFGGDLVSEKSLDEVILAYLADDLPGK